jgi:hypothetical protein
LVVLYLRYFSIVEDLVIITDFNNFGKHRQDLGTLFIRFLSVTWINIQDNNSPRISSAPYPTATDRLSF